MDISFPKLEKKTLKFWKENRIFEKSLKQRAKARNFVFFEGPPTANAKPGIHHVLSRIFKDIICRYKTMRGYKVPRKAGWDTHGLPVELEIEKKLGLKSKKDIERFGIAKFNKLCRKSVWNYKRDWEKLTERIGFWLDMENPYVTYEPDYIETVWWIIKEIYKRGLFYQGHKVVPYCPRCGTSLSSHEVALGYKSIKEPAIYVKFKIKSPKFKDNYLLVWTTTPWTLPGNAAVAINPGFKYLKVRVGKEIFILAKERTEALDKNYKIIGEIKGRDLVGLEYDPLYKFVKPKNKAWVVVPANFVSLKEGTGLVHIAPAFGEEDMEAGKKNNLPVLMTVDETGCFVPEVKKWPGMFVKKADPLIAEDLKKRNLLFKEEAYEHDYPFCWRCDSPLLYYAKQSWFINMRRVQKDLIKNNQKINWIPAHLKEGRFGEWLREVKDWAFSRERYWGTPLPVWQCKKCGKLELIGSKKDLAGQNFSNNKYFIIRHGESLRNKRNIASSWPEKYRLPLTQKGEKQIRNEAKIIKKEKIDLIFSSDILRTRQTAGIIGEELGISPKFDKRLRDINVGIFEGKPIKEVGKFWDPKGKLPRMEYYLERFKVRTPGGESFTDVKKRMYKFLKEIDKKYQNKTILIVGHEAPITMLEGAINGLSRLEIIKHREKSKIKTGELRALKFKIWPYDEESLLDFHRPYIDEVKFLCPKCQNLMERVPEVIDCWFDSGSMPFAQWHWPFGNKDLKPPKLFPADYISEAVDQTRGWFYTLLAISTLLGFQSAYKNVISLGHVLDDKGEKMSKSKGNVIDPWHISEKYGADAARWYFYTVNQPGDAKLFSEKDVEQSLKSFIMILWNSFQFLKTYATQSSEPSKFYYSRNILDRWIVSKLNNLIKNVARKLDDYDVTGAARIIEGFTAEDLSQWYIRRSRKRFQKPETEKELKEAAQTLSFILSDLSKLSAPFIPFLSEEIFIKLGNKKSVHLEDWPKVNKKLIDNNLEEKMAKAREIVNLALAERANAGIKVRQPLNKLQITNFDFKKEKELLELIKGEVNIKEITFGKSLKLDTKITPELKKEGLKREISRVVKDLRKKINLSPQDIVVSITSTASVVSEYMTKQEFKKEMGAKEFIKVGTEEEMNNVDIKKEIELEGKKHYIGIKKQ